MVERICPRCERDNPNTHSFCGFCGAALEHTAQLPARQNSSPLARVSSRLPARWRPAGRVVALGVAAVAVEIGRAALAQQMRPRGTAIVPFRQPPPPASGRVIGLARRVHETWRGGELVQRSDEQIMWVLRDDPRS